MQFLTSAPVPSIDWHPNLSGTTVAKGRLGLSVAAHPRLPLDVLAYRALARDQFMVALLDLLHGCGALVRWRCDARNAEQNIAGLGLP